ncbi:hypothetical protein [uncultured Thiodictyon sp.]|uniref:hypothetical protein n=1 Tax=uncultured Thiodictyon sp. TaxID=1846217 RepID=UPI0025DC6E00|nr:hypothetical protein [uncultured Thiodictyon sp.]
MLARRFGALPDWAEQRLAAASEAQLETWADGVLDANILTEALAVPAANHRSVAKGVYGVAVEWH